MNIEIHQIYYDEKTLQNLDREFIPLQNYRSDKSNWYEFWPMLNYMRQKELREETWYGFLSPRFREKIGIDGKTIKEILKSNHDRAEVFLASPEWDQIAYFKNVFEQGEYCHSNLYKESKIFLKSQNIKVDLDNLVNDSSNSVFSNYIFAKKKYWTNWKVIAEKLFQYANTNENLNQSNIGKYYRGYPLKIFIQERLPAIILRLSKYAAINIDQSKYGPINTILFEDNQNTRMLLSKCDEYKKLFNSTLYIQFLKEYERVKNEIIFKSPKL